MYSVSYEVNITMDTAVGGHYAVQPIGAEGNIPVDGPIVDVGESSLEPPSPLSNAGFPETSENPTYGSPSNSTKPATSDGLSGPSREEGEIAEAVLESSGEVKEEAAEVVTEADGKKENESEVKNLTGKSLCTLKFFLLTFDENCRSMIILGLPLKSRAKVLETFLNPLTL
jgi:hypothetical protein